MILDKYLKKIQEGKVEEAGFEKYPKGWSKKSVKKWANTLAQNEAIKNAATKKGFFDKCVKKMKGRIDNPEGFCASVKDEAHGSTYWRGKDKSSSEVKKDVSKHHNVENITMVSEIEPMSIVAMGAAVYVTTILGIMYKMFVKPFTTKKERACRKVGGPNKQRCYLRFDIESLNKQIAFLNNAKSKCTKTKEPNKCSEKLDKKINELNTKLKKKKHSLDLIK